MATEADQRATLDVPVALFIFNRPRMVESVMAILREVRPSRLLVVADGPRPGHLDDVASCAEARRVATDVDWPCEVETHWGEDNLGCDRRLLSGLDWVFSKVECAIVIEDDVRPDPSFFGWCADLLDRYSDDDSVGIVSGRNTIGCWGDQEASHLLVRYVSAWGWATWADSWRATSGTIRAFDASAQNRLDGLALEPLFHEHVSLLTAQWLSPTGLAWDMKVLVSLALRDVLVAIPPMNLVGNAGFGTEATRMFNADDIAATLRTWSATRTRGDARPLVDGHYDRLAVMMLLLAAYREPEKLLRLAKFSKLLEPQFAGESLPIEHILVPARSVEETTELLRHIRDVSEPAPTVDRLLAAFESVNVRAS